MNRFEQLWIKVLKEIPGAKIVKHSDSWIWSALFWLLKNILRVSTNFDSYTTTIANRIYVPNAWDTWSDTQKYITIRHEMQHLRQFRNWPFKFLGHDYIWWINCLIMGFCYIAVLPVFYTLRAKFEIAGYTQTVLVEKELGFLDSNRAADLVTWLIAQFSSGAYFYMATKSNAQDIALNIVHSVLDGKITNEQDRIA